MIQPGDTVVITRRERRGDRRDRVTTRGRGVAVEVYPRFVLVDLGLWRECFRHDEVRKVVKEAKGEVA